jgi:hypothetical protein
MRSNIRRQFIANTCQHALVFSTGKFQEDQMRLKLNVTHQLLAYADDFTLLGYNIDTINIVTGTSID